MSIPLFTVGETKIRLSPLMLVYLGLCIFLDELAALLPAFLLVLLHELAHGLAAKALGLRVESIELAPFGGVARIHGLETHAGREIAVALAGPLFNALLLLGGSACAYFGMGDTAWLSRFILLNLCLCLFNLLPALPLDGGRVLRAALTGLLGFGRATKLCAWLGIALGAALCGVGVYWAALGEKLPVTLLVAGVYIVLSGSKELRGAKLALLRRAAAPEHTLRGGKTLPVRVLAVPATLTDAEALALCVPGKMTRFCFFDEGMRPTGSAWQSELARRVFG